MLNFASQLTGLWREINTGSSTFKFIGDFCPGELMQDTLHHREFIKICVKQRFDNHLFSLSETRGTNYNPSCMRERAFLYSSQS